MLASDLLHTEVTVNLCIMYVCCIWKRRQLCAHPMHHFEGSEVGCSEQFDSVEIHRQIDFRLRPPIVVYLAVIMEFVNSLIQKSMGSPESAAIIATSVVTLVVGAVYSYHWHLSYQRDGEVPIQWSWMPFLGDAIELGTRPLEFLTESASRHKDIFGMVVAGNRMFIISDPHSSHIVLKPTKDFSFEEFQDLVLHNFFGAEFEKAGYHGVDSFDENLMRKWYSVYLLRYILLVRNCVVW